MGEPPPPIWKLLTDRLAEARVDGRAAGARGLDPVYCPHQGFGLVSLLLRSAWQDGHREGRSGVAPRGGV